MVICVGSTVQPTKVVIGSVEHAALLTHKCVLRPKEHPTTQGQDNTVVDVCQCACEYRWVKNFR